jgi:hypothetical protein
MVLNVVVNGAWGVRAEGPQRLAERWTAFLSRLEQIDPTSFGGWREAADDDSTASIVPLTVPALRDYITSSNPESDAGAVGYTVSLTSVGSGIPKVVVRSQAGGNSPYVTSSCAITLRAAGMDESVVLVRRSTEILAVLAETWDIDRGQVCNREQNAAVQTRFGLKNSDPRCGRSVYLSADRAARVPEGLPGISTRTGQGGLILDLTRGGTFDPDITTIVEVNQRLRASGALYVDR